MTDERVEEVLFEINGKLGAISSKIDAVSDSVLKHESRISTLETAVYNLNIQIHKTNTTDFKEDMLKMMTKCLLIGVTAIASLVGAGGILSKIFL